MRFDIHSEDGSIVAVSTLKDIIMDLSTAVVDIIASRWVSDPVDSNTPSAMRSGRRLPLGFLLSLAYQISLALNYLHSKQWIHTKALNPDNILIVVTEGYDTKSTCDCFGIGAYVSDLDLSLYWLDVHELVKIPRGGCLLPTSVTEMECVPVVLAQTELHLFLSYYGQAKIFLLCF